MKIWCVDYSGLSHNVYSSLFFTKEEAELQMDALPKTGCYKKMYQVEDIWHWCARNFKRVVNEIVAERDSGDDFHYVYGLVEELRATAEHCGIEQFNADLVWIDNSYDRHLDDCVLSVAWFYNDKLEHMMFKLEGCDSPVGRVPLYKRGWENETKNR